MVQSRPICHVLLTLRILGVLILPIAPLWRRRFWGSRLVIVLVASDGQDPSPNCLSVNGLCPPGAVRLLGCRLVLRRHAFVRSAASIANQVAADHLVSWDLGAPYTSPMGSRFNDLVALFRDTVVEIAHQVIKGSVDAGVRHRHGLEDAEHGGDVNHATDAPVAMAG